jgi:hypothetical protein
MLPASTRLVDAMQKWPGSEEPNEAGFALSEGTDLPMMEVVTKNPQRAQRIGKAMMFLQSRPDYNVRFMLENFVWGDAAKGTLVDIGGAKGNVAVEICRHLPEIKCIVLDKPELIEGNKVPDDVPAERLQFVSHDFFTEMSVKDADVYLLGSVLHDWSDKYAIKILRNLVGSLKKGARVLVSDMCLPQPSTISPYKSRVPR